MKKLIAVMLIAVMLLPAVVYACDAPVVKMETRESFAGCAWFALDETRHIAGKWDANAKEGIFSAPGMENPFVKGMLDNGVVRAKGELKYFMAGDMLCGLTKVKISVEITAEYADAVYSIVESRVDGGEMTAANIIAATQWRTAATIYHVFFLPSAPKAAVGTVYLNGGSSTAALYMGEFEGVLVLGFVTGGIPYQEPEATEEPEPETTPEPVSTPEPVVIRDTVYVKETVVREVVQEKTCVKVVQINNQININSTVKNVQKVILNNGGCRKNLPAVCAEE